MQQLIHNSLIYGILFLAFIGAITAFGIYLLVLVIKTLKKINAYIDYKMRKD